MEYGIIGEHLPHSFSREIHRQLAGYDYQLRELRPDQVEDFFRRRDFKAVNVTIPYKQTALPLLDWVDPRAAAIGAVNTVVNRAGRLYGYNTDYDGLKALILRQGFDYAGRRVLILGTGGTSRTAARLAADLGAAEVRRVSRRPSGGGVIGYEEAARDWADADYLINTTPVGMFPELDGCPLDLAPFARLRGVTDVVYNPLRTRLVLEARERGIPACGGLYMLVAQAVAAVERFLDAPQPPEAGERVFLPLLREKENLVLTGMPGSGKSAVGRELARALGRDLLDTDALIRQRTGETPAELIRRRGEAAFREIESRTVAECAGRTGCVIATGGGVILREENMRRLRQNGRIFFRDRPLEELVPTADRPLSSDRAALERRYRERYGRYCATADFIVRNTRTVKAAAEAILEVFHEISDLERT